jgi:hypothetical protein
VPEVWTPGAEGPHEAFVERLIRVIARFAEDAGVEKAVVEIELADTGRFVLDSISAEPGYGFVTLRVQPTDAEDADVPEALVVPVGSLRRVELRRAADEQVRFGFTLPEERQA